MVEVPMKHYWMGEDIETLSREQLIDAVKQIGRELESARSIMRSTNEIWRLANKFGRAA